MADRAADRQMLQTVEMKSAASQPAPSCSWRIFASAQFHLLRCTVLIASQPSKSRPSKVIAVTQASLSPKTMPVSAVTKWNTKSVRPSSLKSLGCAVPWRSAQAPTPGITSKLKHTVFGSTSRASNISVLRIATIVAIALKLTVFRNSISIIVGIVAASITAIIASPTPAPVIAVSQTSGSPSRMSIVPSSSQSTPPAGARAPVAIAMANKSGPALPDATPITLGESRAKIASRVSLKLGPG